MGRHVVRRTVRRARPRVRARFMPRRVVRRPVRRHIHRPVRRHVHHRPVHHRRHHHHHHQRRWYRPRYWGWNRNRYHTKTYRTYGYGRSYYGGRVTGDWVYLCWAGIIALFVCLVVLIVTPFILIGVGVANFATLGVRQGQIDTINSFTAETWPASETEFDTLTTVEILADSSPSALSKSTSPKYSMTALSDPSDDPALIDYSTVYYSGNAQFPSTSWTNGKTGSFSVRMDAVTSSATSQVLTKEETYSCNCVEYCDYCRRTLPTDSQKTRTLVSKSLVKKRPNNVINVKKAEKDKRRYWDDDYYYDDGYYDDDYYYDDYYDTYDDYECCYTECDTCYRYVKLSKLCLKVDPSVSTSIGTCFGTPEYVETTSGSQAVTVAIEVRHVDDPDVYFYESVTGFTGNLHMSDGQKIVIGSVTLIIGLLMLCCPIIVCVLLGVIIGCAFCGKQQAQNNNAKAQANANAQAKPTNTTTTIVQPVVTTQPIVTNTTTIKPVPVPVVVNPVQQNAPVVNMQQNPMYNQNMMNNNNMGMMNQNQNMGMMNQNQNMGMMNQNNNMMMNQNNMMNQNTGMMNQNNMGMMNQNNMGMMNNNMGMQPNQIM